VRLAQDKYGLSWQLVPRGLAEMFADPDRAKADRVMQAMLRIKKLDVAALKRAYAGERGATA
jgi:predicted 3-demethylubiquinone-9 3-methyltransferase (glyoxalase superfamily)